MANSDKNIFIIPNIGSTSDDPKIVFSGADSSTSAQDITIKAYPVSNGTLSIEGSAGQLFSVTNSLSGTLFSVNDVSGIPSIEVLDDGTIKLAEYGGNIIFNESGADVDFRVEGDTDANLLFVDASTDNVGIGTSSPNYKLEVNGSFAATTKSFVIDHPTKPNMKLRYGSLESPYHGIRLTGEATITEKTVRVNLPDYIHGLCKQEGAQVQLTNIKHGKVLWVETVDVDKDYFEVSFNKKSTDKKSYSFYWSFTAIRKDIEDMVVEFD